MAKKNRYNLIQYNRAAVDYTPPEPFSASYGILTVIGRDGEPIPVNGYSDFFITHRQDGWDKVNFALPVDLEIYREITEETIVRYADNEYSVKKIKNGRIEGEINLGFLRGIYYEHYELTAKTLSYALSGILPTGWTAVGAVLIPGTITLSLEHSTGVDIVNALMSAFNVYFVWNCAHRTCTVISADTAEDRGQYMTDELNLKQVSYTGSTADFCTVLYCYGRDNESIESVNGGKKYIENHTYSAKRIVGVFTCDYYEPLHIMIAGVREMLRRCKPEQSYECDVVDLAKLSPTYSFLDFSLHQSATLIDRKRELNVKHRIIEYKEYPDEPERNVVTLSQSAPHYPEIVEKERKKLATEVSSVQRTASDAKVSAAQAQTSADEAKAVADDTKSSLSGYVKTNDLSSSIDTYVDSSSGKARITSSLSGTYQTVEGMSGYVKTTQLSADIGAYIDTQAGTAKIVNAVSGTYATQDALGNYLQKTELSAGINTYIDTQAGTAKITAAVAGTYAEKTALGDYEKKVDLSADIGSYIDTQAGTAKLTAALEGTFAEKRAFEGYVKKTELSADIGAYIDTQSGKAKITAALSGTFVEGSELELYEKVSDMSADIGAYIDTQAGTAKVVSACSGYYVDFDYIADYEKVTDLSTDIGQYIDSQAGTAKIISSVSGTYQKKSDMADYAQRADLDDYLEKTELNAGIETYIDTVSGQAKIISSVSGTYQTKAGMSDYATQTDLADYLEKTDLDAGIETYINTASGKAKIVQSVSGTYQTIAGMSNYATNAALDDYLEKSELDAGIETYIDTQSGKAKIVSAVSGTYATKTDLDGYETKNSLSADIGSYIDTQAGQAKVVSACSGTYQTKSGMSDYVTTTGLNTSIGQYLDTATGKAKIESAVSGTYQKKSDMGDYVETTELNTKIGQYIDGSTGTAKIVSACSGTYQTTSGMSSYYTKTQVDSEISQSVSPVESAISLTAAYGSGTIGSNVRALLQLVANADRSTITINADKIDFSGFTTFLRASDLGSNGSTTIDGGRITTGEISADRIKVQKLYATYSSSMYPIAYANSSGLYIGHWDGSVGGTIDKTYVGGNHIYIGNNTTGEVEFNNSSKVFRPLSTTSNYTIGSSDYPFKAIYAKAFYLNGSQISGGIAETDVNKIYCASSTSNYIGLSSSKDFVASGTGFSLGSTSYPFDEFYCGNSSYYLKHSSAGIIPNTTSTSSSYFQLGSTSYPFNDLYVKNLHVSGSFDLSGSTVKMGGTSSYYIEANTSRELKPSSSSATYPAYLGTSSIYWHYAYIGSNTVMIGSSGTASGSKLGFFGTTAVVRQSLSLSSNNMSYSSVTASNYLYALNNLIGILKKHGLISA